MAFLVVARLLSRIASPSSSQQRLVLSPRSRPIVIGRGTRLPRCGLCRAVIFFFMAGLLLHLECVSIGSVSHPAGGRPSHPISWPLPDGRGSENHALHAVAPLGRSLTVAVQKTTRS